VPVVANILQPLTEVEEWVLETLHGIGLTWGLAIVGLTLLTRMTTIPLVVRQFRTQREIKLHMPEMKRIQEKYGKDMEKRSKAMLQVRLFQALFLTGAAVGVVVLAMGNGGEGVGMFLLIAGLLGFCVLVAGVGYWKAGR